MTICVDRFGFRAILLLRKYVLYADYTTAPFAGQEHLGWPLALAAQLHITESRSVLIAG